jgi:hypothetical protein
MKAIRRHLLTAIILMIFILPGISQNDDFGVWYGISTSMSIKKKLDLEFQTQLRTFKNATKIDEGYLDGGIEYQWRKNVSFALNYRLSEVYEKDLDYHIRHKWFADIKAEHDIGNINLSGRFRLQRQDKTYFDSESDKIPDYHGRIRLKLEYKTPSFPLNPYIYVESFIRMFEYSDKRNDKNKYSAGITYKISKKQSIDAEYVFQRDYEPHLSDINLIAIEYKLKFK